MVIGQQKQRPAQLAADLGDGVAEGADEAGGLAVAAPGAGLDGLGWWSTASTAVAVSPAIAPTIAP